MDREKGNDSTYSHILKLHRTSTAVVRGWKYLSKVADRGTGARELSPTAIGGGGGAVSARHARAACLQPPCAAPRASFSCGIYDTPSSVSHCILAHMPLWWGSCGITDLRQCRGPWGSVLTSLRTLCQCSAPRARTGGTCAARAHSSRGSPGLGRNWGVQRARRFSPLKKRGVSDIMHQRGRNHNVIETKGERIKS